MVIGNFVHTKLSPHFMALRVQHCPQPFSTRWRVGVPRQWRALLALTAMLASSDGQLCGQSTDRLVRLPYSVGLTVPQAWTSPDSSVARKLRSRTAQVDLSGTLPDESGALLVLRPLSPDDGEASVVIMVLPTEISQARLAAMAPIEINAADHNYFLPEAETAASNTGRTITRWDGTQRTTVGGRYGLVTLYVFERPDGPPLRKETYAAYLGSRKVVVHVHLPLSPGSAAELAVRSLLASLTIGAREL